VVGVVGAAGGGEGAGGRVTATMVIGAHDAALTAGAQRVRATRQRAVSVAVHVGVMTETSADIVIRQAIGGDAGAMAWIVERADTTDLAVVIAMAGLLEGCPGRLDRAWAVATVPRDRQVVAIAQARLAGDDELVDALARDHLVDHPDSYVVAWIASGAAGAARRDRT
jgi:hypothetical protein